MVWFIKVFAFVFGAHPIPVFIILNPYNQNSAQISEFQFKKIKANELVENEPAKDFLLNEPHACILCPSS